MSSLDILAKTPFKTLELHLGGFSPHLPSNRTIKEALCCMRTEILNVSKQAETRDWMDVARTMRASRLHVLLPTSNGPEDEDLFDFDHFQDHWDLSLVVEPPKDHLNGLPPEVRNIVYQMLLLQPQAILPLDCGEDPFTTAKRRILYEKSLDFLVFAEPSTRKLHQSSTAETSSALYRKRWVILKIGSQRLAYATGRNSGT